MIPEYYPEFFAGKIADPFDELKRLLWSRVSDNRSEIFMSDVRREYTYGSGRGVRTYTSEPMQAVVGLIKGYLPDSARSNVCFLNRYHDRGDHLGWHADDASEIDHTDGIYVVSFGQPREIWWRPNGLKGEVPPFRRQLLGHGSLFVMPPGFQETHQHRIPKGDREMGERISLTFRTMS